MTFQKHPILSLTAAALLALALGGCSARGGYEAGQTWQRNECSRELDREAQQRCLERAATPYDAYRRQRDATLSTSD